VCALLVLLLLAPWASAAGEDQTPPPNPSVQEQLQQQQQRISELERLLKQQGLLLEVLRQQLASLQGQPGAAAQSAPVPGSASGAAPAVQEVSVVQELDRLSGEVNAVAASNQQLNEKVSNLEQKNVASEKSLAEKLKGLGNFSFSGDLRLRYEPFFGGTQDQDRHRERFRLRFNVVAKLNNDFTGGFSLATGDGLEPISTNQTLSPFFLRKNIAIDRAFLQWNPHQFKPLTLTGGKFAYTWYRTELTWDNDLNPEGFSEAFSFDFKNPYFKKLTLVGFQLPFRETSGDDDSFVAGGQVGSFWRFGERVRFAGYATFYNWLRADPVAAALAASSLTGNSNTNTVAPGNLFASNFAILNLIGRVDIDTGSPRWPLLLQLDFANNTRPCTNVPVPECNPRDRSGWWAEAQVGKTQERHDLSVGYTFIRIEREAVLGAFNFSDLRQATNVVNHRFNFGYQVYKNVTLNYTLLVGRQLRTATSPDREPWLKRMQIDAIYKF
jgi:hypothetical protein